MIANLIRNLTSGQTTSNRTSPRRAFRPTLDGLETRVVLNGAYTVPPSYTPPATITAPTTTTTATTGTSTATQQYMAATAPTLTSAYTHA